MFLLLVSRCNFFFRISLHSINLSLCAITTSLKLFLCLVVLSALLALILKSDSCHFIHLFFFTMNFILGGEDLCNATQNAEIINTMICLSTRN